MQSYQSGRWQRRSPAATLRIDIAPDAHQVGQFTTEHDVQCRPISKRGISSFHPGVSALGFAEDDAKSLVDAHQIGEPGLAVTVYPTLIASLPAAIGAH